MSKKAKERRLKKAQEQEFERQERLKRGGVARQTLEKSVSEARGAVYYQTSDPDTAPRQYYVENLPVHMNGKVVAYHTRVRRDAKGDPIERPIPKYHDGKPRYSISSQPNKQEKVESNESD